MISPAEPFTVMQRINSRYSIRSLKKQGSSSIYEKINLMFYEIVSEMMRPRTQSSIQNVRNTELQLAMKDFPVFPPGRTKKQTPLSVQKLLTIHNSHEEKKRGKISESLMKCRLEHFIFITFPQNTTNRFERGQEKKTKANIFNKTKS